MTETCGPHTIDRMDEDLPERLRGSFGRSVPGLEHKIVDPQSGQRRATGEFGEICVRGYSVMQGLYKVEREEAFDADGFYHTGDSGRFDDEGFLFFRARLGDLIKTGGANVSPREIEVVMNAIPEVKEAHVVGLPDPHRGQSVAAAVILQDGAERTAAQLREQLREELSAYKIPSHFLFFRSAELPLTDSGKIDKRRLQPLLIERLSA
jgi:acyl-CoA synthetase (AMP-forming)/AMP-acid ligase II